MSLPSSTRLVVCGNFCERVTAVRGTNSRCGALRGDRSRFARCSPEAHRPVIKRLDDSTDAYESNSWQIAQCILSLPVKMSHHSRQSPRKLNIGYWNVAGLLCSKKKWPTQANA